MAIALPLLESMPTLRAAQKAAKSAGPVKRFVCLSNNYGIYKKGFFPAAAGTDYALPPTLNPLERHRRDFTCLLYTSPSPRDATLSRMPSSA